MNSTGSNIEIAIKRFGFTNAHLTTYLIILDTLLHPHPINTTTPISQHQTQTQTHPNSLSSVGFSTLPDFSLDALMGSMMNTLPAHVMAKIPLVLKLLTNPYSAYILTGHFASIETLSISDRESVLASFSQSPLSLKRLIYSALVTYPLAQAYAQSMFLGRAIGYPVEGDPRLLSQPNRRQPSYPYQFLKPSLEPKVIEVDVLIIGSGAGGSVVASILAKAGHNVLVVEKGIYVPTEEISGSPQVGSRLFEGNGLLTTANAQMTILAGSTFGGGTTINWSASISTPYHIRHTWATQYGLPYFLTDDFTNDLAVVNQRLGVSTSSIKHSRANQIFMLGCRRAGIHVDEIPQNTAGHTHDCGLCNNGCPFGEKQGATRTWLQDCAQAGGQFMTEARVERILFGDRPQDVSHSSHYLDHRSRPSRNRRRAVGALVRLGNQSESNPPVVIRARKAVVCSAGSLNTPAILLRSGLDGGGMVGLGLHLHPVSFVTGWFDEDIDPWEGSIMTAISCEVENIDGNHFGSKIEVLSSSPGLYLGAATLWKSSESHKRNMSEYRRSFTLVIICRDRDRGRVRLDETGQPLLDYEVSQHDQESLLAGVVKGCEILKAAGARRIKTAQQDVDTFEVKQAASHPQDFNEWIQKVQHVGIRPGQGVLGSAHQMGSCPMGNRKRTSVVNEGGKVWDTEGLYIADASVMPTATGVNPAITTMAVAHAIGQSIKKELRQQDLRGDTQEMSTSKL